MNKPQKRPRKATGSDGFLANIVSGSVPLRVEVADATLLQQDGFQRVTTSLRNHAHTLAQVGGGKGCRPAAQIWAAVLSALLPTTPEQPPAEGDS